ncbi:hypothetical protein CC86DRAFT_419312 [Ophiobolus disseminans]|uniref:Uncharacterized protein n=1 Tax=Ophiobolus disseminans TaxID=1469910 RepID=A0A6A6ZWD9_9PLEO|nr:hypothetical protein CC86DRAFT_419312 [Ophiobolus disseminans]
MWEFREKECSDAHDLGYSLTSLSSDGAKLPVDYGCSITKVIKNVLRLSGNCMCMCKALLILESLPFSRALVRARYFNLAFLLIEADDIQTPETTRCKFCDMQASAVLHGLSGDSIAKTKWICLNCGHNPLQDLFRHRLHHLILIQYKEDPDHICRLFLSGYWGYGVKTDHTRLTIDEDDLYVVNGNVKGVRLSIDLMHEFLSHFKHDFFQKGLDTRNIIQLEVGSDSKKMLWSQRCKIAQ